MEMDRRIKVGLGELDDELVTTVDACAHTHIADPKQPDNDGGNEFCVQVYGPKKPSEWGNAWYGQWNDRVCDKRLGYICQKHT
jgi:hypothetical protein